MQCNYITAVCVCQIVEVWDDINRLWLGSFVGLTIPCVCVCACVRVCMRACVHVCVRACVRAYVHVQYSNVPKVSKLVCLYIVWYAMRVRVRVCVCVHIFLYYSQYNWDM